MKVAWGNKVSREFVDKVIKICEDFRWSDDHVSWLMACMAFESGETFSPRIYNAAGSGSVGLIQFMPPTAKGLGTSNKELSLMSGIEQLDYVKAYFKPYYNKIRDLPSMYMAILMPKYIDKPLSNVLFLQGTVAFRQNSGLDANHDGKITKAEAASLVTAKYLKGLRDGYVLDV